MNTKNKALIFVLLISSLGMLKPSYGSYRTPASLPTSDRYTEHVIHQELAADLITKDTQLSIITRGYGATISGVARTVPEAIGVVSVVASNPAIKTIDTRGLYVKGYKNRLTDLYIAAKIRGRLGQQCLVEKRSPHCRSRVQVVSQDGVVYLTGSVPSLIEKRNIIFIATHTEEVKEVRSSLKIK